jgi:hypothetical protein
MKEVITHEQARKMADEIARSDLAELVMDQSIPFLATKYLEAEYCWIFFRNESIVLNQKYSLRWDWAYAISKKGNARHVYDFRGDEERMKSYLQELSNFFRERGE